MAMNGKTVVIGAGSMGGALLTGWVKAGLLIPGRVTVVDLDQAKLTELSRRLKVLISQDPADSVRKSSLVLLAVKPQQMRELTTRLGPLLPKGALVVSIAAGVSTSQIEKRLPRGNPVVRVMPNTPALLGCGMAGVSRGKRARVSHARLVRRLFDAVGRTVEVPERLLDAVTALSGSGPAYFFRMVEALVDAGVERGLSQSQALLLVSQTALGAARMMVETGKDPAALRAQVTSPGGTTQAGLAVLEKKAFPEALKACVRAAEKRGADLRRMND